MGRLPGVRIVPWQPERDRAAWAALAEAFRDHWGYMHPNYEQFQLRFHGAHSRPDLWRLALDEASGEVAGVCLVVIDPAASALTGRADGLVEELGVRRPWRRRGVGRALLIAGMEALRQAGMTAAVLGVDSESPTGANRLYEQVGYRVVLESRAYGQPL
ncbi:MAG TPA: GNAT family N-acetyltransferase [Anaerolineae bacterium]|nr:GNAT family N-acetyltransferase [Anaerolineae bacterium]HPL29575.1 GNAT family N-acetyltransferase [Anaerolineae bacterium]